jgi:hypothetical protein
MTAKRIRMSKQQLNKAYQNRYRRALSGTEIDAIARQRDVALCRPARKPVIKRKAHPTPS